MISAPPISAGCRQSAWFDLFEPQEPLHPIKRRPSPSESTCVWPAWVGGHHRVAFLASDLDRVRSNVGQTERLLNLNVLLIATWSNESLDQPVRKRQNLGVLSKTVLDRVLSNPCYPHINLQILLLRQPSMNPTKSTLAVLVLLAFFSDASSAKAQSRNRRRVCSPAVTTCHFFSCQSHCGYLQYGAPQLYRSRRSTCCAQAQCCLHVNFGRSCPGGSWGACEQTAYNNRRRCYQNGGNATKCEPIYDGAVAYCNANCP